MRISAETRDIVEAFGRHYGASRFFVCDTMGDCNRRLDIPPTVMWPATAWQYVTMTFAKSQYRKVDKLTVWCDYDYSNGSATFDCLQLVRDSIETDGRG